MIASPLFRGEIGGLIVLSALGLQSRSNSPAVRSRIPCLPFGFHRGRTFVGLVVFLVKNLLIVVFAISLSGIYATAFRYLAKAGSARFAKKAALFHQPLLIMTPTVILREVFLITSAKNLADLVSRVKMHPLKGLDLYLAKARCSRMFRSSLIRALGSQASLRLRLGAFHVFKPIGAHVSPAFRSCAKGSQGVFVTLAITPLGFRLTTGMAFTVAASYFGGGKSHDVRIAGANVITKVAVAA